MKTTTNETKAQGAEVSRETNKTKEKVQRSTADILKRFKLHIDAIETSKIAKPEEIKQLRDITKTFMERWIGLEIQKL